MATSGQASTALSEATGIKRSTWICIIRRLGRAGLISQGVRGNSQVVRHYDVADLSNLLMALAGQKLALAPRAVRSLRPLIGARVEAMILAPSEQHWLTLHHSDECRAGAAWEHWASGDVDLAEGSRVPPICRTVTIHPPAFFAAHGLLGETTRPQSSPGEPSPTAATASPPSITETH